MFRVICHQGVTATILLLRLMPSMPRECSTVYSTRLLDRRSA